MLHADGLRLSFRQPTDESQGQPQTLLAISLIIIYFHSSIINLDGGLALTQQIDTTTLNESDTPSLTIDNTTQFLTFVPKRDKTILHYIGCLVLVAKEVLSHALHGGLQRQDAFFELLCFAFHTL